MWIIEDVQSSIKNKIGSRDNALERGPLANSMTLTISVDGREGIWFIDVPNTTTVIMLKNRLRYREITNRSCEEIDIFFNNIKLANKYWYLPDYHIENFSKLVVKHREALLEQKEPPEPLLIKLGDAERKVLIKQRLISRRLEDIFSFAVLHALYDPNSSESSYVLSEVADLGAFKTTTDKPKSSSTPAPYHLSPKTGKMWKSKSSSQYKFSGGDVKSSKSPTKFKSNGQGAYSTSWQATSPHKSRYTKLTRPSRNVVRSSRRRRHRAKTPQGKNSSSSKAYSFQTFADDVKAKPKIVLSPQPSRVKSKSAPESPEVLLVSESTRSSRNNNPDPAIIITSASHSSRINSTNNGSGGTDQGYKESSSDCKFGQLDSKPPTIKLSKVISL